MQIVSWRSSGSDWLSLDWSYTRTRGDGSNWGGAPKRTGNEEGKVSPKRLIFWASRISAGRTAWDGLQFGARRSANACGESFDTSSRSPQANARSLVPNRPLAEID